MANKDPVKQTKEQIKALNDLRKSQGDLNKEQRVMLDNLRKQLAILNNLDKRQAKLTKEGGVYADLSKQWATNALSQNKGQENLSKLQKGQMDMFQKALGGQLTSVKIGEQKANLEDEISTIGQNYFGKNQAHGVELQEQVKAMIEMLDHIEDVNQAYSGVNNKATELDKQMGPLKKGWEDVKAKVTDFTTMLWQNPVKTIIGTLVAGVVLLAKHFIGIFNSSMAMQKELGVGVGHAMDLNIATQEAAAGGFMYGEGIEEVSARASTLVEEWGVVNQETKNSIAAATELERHYGVSTTAAASLAQMMEATSTSTKDVLLSDMQGQMSELQKELFRSGKVMEEVASDTDFFAKFMKKGGKNVIKAAAFAKKLGMSMETISGSANALLDWEESINAEMEASVLLGREVNMERARELAFAGDLEGMQKEIMRQVGSEADFQRMNVVQREALAAAAGVTLTDLTKMVAAEAKLGKMTSKERKDQERNAKVTKNIQGLWSKIVGIFQTMYKKFITPIADKLLDMLGFTGGIGDDLTSQSGIWESIEAAIGKAFEWISGIVISVIDWFVALGTVGKNAFSLEVMFQNLWIKIVAIWDKFKGWLNTIGLIVAAVILLPPLFAAMGGGAAIAGGGIAAMGTALAGIGAAAVPIAIGIGILVLAMAGLALGIYLLAKAIEHGEKGIRIFADVVGGFILDVLGELTDMIVRLAPYVVSLAEIVGGVIIDAFTIFKDLVIGTVDALAGLVTALSEGIVNTFRELAAIGREGGLGMAAIGIAAIGVALLGFGVGGGIGAIAGAIGDFFGKSPVEKFKKFGELGPSLTQTGEAMRTLTTSMQNFKSIGIKDMASATQQLAKALTSLAKASHKVNKAQRAALRTQAMKGIGQWLGIIDEDAPNAPGGGGRGGGASTSTSADVAELQRAIKEQNAILQGMRNDAARHSRDNVGAVENAFKNQ
jgi:hypothetical protein